MRVYTDQSIAVLRALKQGKPYYAWRSRAYHRKYEAFERAYDWMRTQYEGRTGIRLREGQDLIWVWPLRAWAMTPYSPQVRLELEVDPRRLLFSDYQMWHLPLNGDYEDAESIFDMTRVEEPGAAVQGVMNVIYPYELVGYRWVGEGTRKRGRGRGK